MVENPGISKYLSLFLREDPFLGDFFWIIQKSIREDPPGSDGILEDPG
jgi:hypothetical protein